MQHRRKARDMALANWNGERVRATALNPDSRVHLVQGVRGHSRGSRRRITAMTARVRGTPDLR